MEERRQHFIMPLLYRILYKKFCTLEVPLSTLMSDIRYSSEKALKWILYRLIPYCFLYPFFKIFGRLEVEGIENLKGQEGILIASNHLSNVDPPLLATIIPGGCVFMAKHELFNISILKHLIRYYAFPVNRKKPSVSTIRTTLAKLADGNRIVIFPEGRRNRGPLLPPKSGIGMITVLSKKKVVPALIVGTDKLLPPGKLMPRPTRVRVVFGKPLDLGHEGADYSGISKLIMEHIKTMSK